MTNRDDAGEEYALSAREGVERNLRLIIETAERVERAGVLTADDRVDDRISVPRDRHALEAAWSFLGEWIDRLTEGKASTRGALYMHLADMLATSHRLGAATIVRPSTTSFAWRTRTAGAREKREPQTARRRAEIRLAILDTAKRETLRRTPKYAGSILTDVNERLEKGGRKGTSARTIQRVIHTILKECGDEASQS